MPAPRRRPLLPYLLHSLRGRLMLLMLGAALPAFLILLYGTFLVREQTIDRIEGHILNQARVLALQHAEQVEATRRLLAALADMPELQSDDRRGCNELLRGIHRQVPAYLANLSAISADGHILCSAEWNPRFVDVADRPHHRRALAATGFVGGDYIVSRLTGKPVVIFTHTVRRDGAVALILAASLDLSWLQAHPLFADLPPGAAYELYGYDGTLLLRHSAGEPRAGVGQDLSASPLWHSLGRLPAAGAFRGRDNAGVEQLFGYAPLGPADSPYARLLVSVPVQSADSEPDRLLGFGLLGLALAGILGLALGWFGGWMLVLRPMQPIFATVRSLAAGDLDARTGLPAGHTGEIHRLAMEVDRLAAVLAQENLERGRFELALREERDRAQAYLDIVGVMVLALDRRGRITLANPKSRDILGCRPDGACCAGKDWFDAFAPPEGREAARRAFGRLMAGKAEPAAYFESEVQTHAGERRLVAWHNALLRDGKGTIVGMLSAGEDITLRRQLEEEREKLQRQLQQSQKMNALGQLTGGIAHDFNNILASVLGFSKLALKRHVPDPDSPLAEYLGEIIAAGERARDLIAKMLTFSRARPSGEVLALAPQPLVKEALHMLVSTIPASIRINSQFDPGIPDVAIAPVDLHQILMNLVINARDAIEGRGRIDIRLSRVCFAKTDCSACHAEFSGEYVVLSVADTGSGIPAEVLPRIFEPFFTTKDVGKGTGMGLSMVHSMVCHAGGHLLVDSRAGEGSLFQVLLPPAKVVAPASAPSHPAGQAAPPQKRGRVLVVDDEPAIRRLLAAALDAAGWSVRAVGEARQALECLRQAPEGWDAVIADQAMPDLTGTELLAALHGIRPGLPIILCTGYSDELDEVSARESGAHGFFHKPVDTETLLATLADLLPGQT